MVKMEILFKKGFVTRIPAFALLFNRTLDILARTLRQEKRNKRLSN